jgi:hypothetical protein
MEDKGVITKACDHPMGPKGERTPCMDNWKGHRWCPFVGSFVSTYL